MYYFFFFKQKTAYDMRISDCSSDVCSSDLRAARHRHRWPIVVETDFGDGRGGIFGRGLGAQRIARIVGHQQQHQLLQPRIVADQQHTLGFAGKAVDHVEQRRGRRSEEHTSELQTLMRISYAVSCLKKKKKKTLVN